MAAVTIPPAAPIGTFWERGSADTYSQWTEPGKACHRVRREARRFIERWLVQENGLSVNSSTGEVLPESFGDSQLQQLRSTFVDHVGDQRADVPGLENDNGEFFKAAGFADDPSAYSGNEQYTGLVGKYIRLASKTWPNLQTVFTDEQSRMESKFDAAADRVERGLAVGTITDLCIAFLNFLGALVARVPPDMWRTMYALLDEIADTLGFVVPRLLTQSEWLQFTAGLDARKGAGDQFVEEQQKKRSIEYREAMYAERWHNLPRNEFEGREIGGYGECFFLSIAYMFEQSRPNVLSSDGKYDEPKWLEAERFRKDIVTDYMADKRPDGGRRYRYYREKVLTMLMGNIGSFVQEDCHEPLFGEQTLMRTAAQFDEVSTEYRVEYSAYPNETYDQAEARRDAIFAAWLKIMGRSKIATLRWGIKDHPDTVHSLLLSMGYNHLRLNTPKKLRREIKDFMMSVPVAYASEAVVEAAAWRYRMRINVYNYVKAHDMRDADKWSAEVLQRRLEQNRRWAANLVPAYASYGRLSWSPWRAFLYCATANVNVPVSAPGTGRHYQPIVLKGSSGTGSYGTPAGSTPGMNQEKRETEEMALVMPSDGGAGSASADKDAQRMAEAEQQARLTQDAVEKSRIAREEELAAIAAAELNARQREERERLEQARKEEEDAAAKAEQDATRRRLAEAAALARQEADRRAEVLLSKAEDDAQRQAQEESLRRAADEAQRREAARRAAEQLDSRAKDDTFAEQLRQLSTREDLAKKRAAQRQAVQNKKSKLPQPPSDPPPSPPTSPPGGGGSPPQPYKYDARTEAGRKIREQQEMLRRKGADRSCWDVDPDDEMAAMQMFLCLRYKQMNADDDDKILQRDALQESKDFADAQDDANS